MLIDEIGINNCTIQIFETNLNLPTYETQWEMFETNWENQYLTFLFMRIRWRQTTWVVLVPPPHYPHTKFEENRSLRSH